MVEILTAGLSLIIFKDICKALWCHRVGRKCETKFMPAAEGSACGPDMVKNMCSTCVCLCVFCDTLAGLLSPEWPQNSA